MIKLKYLVYAVLFFTINFQNDKYAKAVSLIINSEEYKNFKVNEGNYAVSQEIIGFYFFGDSYDYEVSPNYFLEDEVKDTDNDLLKLNTKKRGKVKIFFSEEKHNLFFAEIFYTKGSMFKYSERPDFGQSYLYTFKHEENNITLQNISIIHYN